MAPAFCWLRHAVSSDSSEQADGSATPKPAAAKKDDSDSEFELSLDLDDSSATSPVAKKAPMQDSEFELTLDDSTDLSASDSKNPQVKSVSKISLSPAFT